MRKMLFISTIASDRIVSTKGLNTQMKRA